jgi:hypothetical protein
MTQPATIPIDGPPHAPGPPEFVEVSQWAARVAHANSAPIEVITTGQPRAGRAPDSGFVVPLRRGTGG